jgi:putative transposase
VIHVEDLNIVGMIANRRLARAISDAGWGPFVRIIGEKADRYGRTAHPVSPWLASSKTCSACGRRLDELPLHVRKWTWCRCSRRELSAWSCDQLSRLPNLVSSETSACGQCHLRENRRC